MAHRHCRSWDREMVIDTFEALCEEYRPAELDGLQNIFSKVSNCLTAVLGIPQKNSRIIPWCIGRHELLPAFLPYLWVWGEKGSAQDKWIVSIANAHLFNFKMYSCLHYIQCTALSLIWASVSTEYIVKQDATSGINLTRSHKLRTRGRAAALKNFVTPYNTHIYPDDRLQ